VIAFVKEDFKIAPLTVKLRKSLPFRDWLMVLER